jgi:hypothetical protein
MLLYRMVATYVFPRLPKIRDQDSYNGSDPMCACRCREKFVIRSGTMMCRTRSSTKLIPTPRGSSGSEQTMKVGVRNSNPNM